MVSSVKSMLILLLFLTVALHESGTRKAMSWSVESVQDKFNLFTPFTKFKETNNTACGKN